MIQVNAVIFRPLLVNTYVVHETKTHEAFIIDPGGDFNAIVKIIDKENITPKFILYTHLHIDHIAGGFELSNQLMVPSYASESDLYLFNSLEQAAKFLAYPNVTPPEIDGYINDGDEFEIGDFKIRVIHTPGHTPGGCSFLLEDHVFTGDTLFKEGIGRTDLWGGDEKTLHLSIREKLYSLPESTTIHAGHGEYSTIGFEKKNNPFVRLDS